MKKETKKTKKETHLRKPKKNKKGGDHGRLAHHCLEIHTKTVVERTVPREFFSMFFWGKNENQEKPGVPENSRKTCYPDKVGHLKISGVPRIPNKLASFKLSYVSPDNSKLISIPRENQKIVSNFANSNKNHYFLHGFLHLITKKPYKK